MIGTVLQDRYKIEKEIGRGGVATVYLGYDTKLKRNIAVKVLDAGRSSEAFKAHFLREAESMAKLSHPNIVTVHDCAEFEGVPYFVMEYVNGPALIALADSERASLSWICATGVQVCRGMAYAHRNGVVHGDLTLKNIIIGEDDESQAKILDFGLARLLHEEDETTGDTLVGTPFYLAPEQIRHEAIDEKTDIYAFGVGMYRLVRGRYPFQAQHPAALLYVILNEHHLPGTEGVPVGLHDLIVECLAKERDERPSGFEELGERLGRLAAELGKDEEDEFSLGEFTVVPRQKARKNPYLNRVMIQNPDEFFGRTVEVRRIYARLGAQRPQSVSVVGERRIGKSSLLNFIYHPKSRRALLPNHENAIFAYLDFQSRMEFDVQKFIDFLFNMFEYELGEEFGIALRERSLDELREIVGELSRAGKRVVVVMDEFEVITRNPHFDAGFFSFLRSLANTYKVAYVTSSREDLQKMCHNRDIADSPFFNIFSNLPLRGFSDDEAADLIRKPSEKEGVPLEEYTDRILDIGGRFPLFLQIACSSTFENLVETEGGEPNWSRVRERFMEEADQHFRSVWERLDDASREALSRLAAGKMAKKKYVTERLIRDGYVRVTAQGTDLFASTFGEWVVEALDEGSGRRSFFGRWMSRTDGE
jgi:AAA+ ATPase superfamily predicted ATPase/predicted Ser/Thr protein kinase